MTHTQCAAWNREEAICLREHLYYQETPNTKQP
jgi:hypothetical protein